MNTLQYEERDFTVISLKYTQPHKKDECQIEEIAALRIRDGHTVNTWTALVRESSENNTCLSAAESDSESSFKQLLRQFLEFIGTDIIVTYQADTVIPLINNECRRLSLPSLSGTYIDILPMAEKVLPRQRRYDLSVLADHFQITPPDGRTIQNAGQFSLCICVYLPACTGSAENGPYGCLRSLNPNINIWKKPFPEELKELYGVTYAGDSVSIIFI